MSFLDALSGGAYDRAAKNNMAAIGTGLNQSGDALLKSYGTAQGLLLDGSGPSALTGLQGGFNQARQDLGTQYGQTQGYLGQLGSNYSHMADTGRSAFDAYANAVGANGAAGSAAATADFQAAPGYQYARDQALDAVQRTAAARGGLAGGNATADILRTSMGLADQGFQQYVQNLGNAASSYGTGLAGQSQGLTGQANASQAYGNALGSLGTGLGTGTASIYGAGASGQQALGNALSGNVLNSTKMLVDNNDRRAAGQTAASANALGLVGGLANSALGQLGGSGGFAGLARLFGGGGGGDLSLSGFRDDQWS